MAATLGKRKRVTRAELEQPSRSPSPSSGSGDDDSDAEDLQAAFRRAFEAKFKPLPVEPKRPRIEEAPVEEEESQEEETDWSGISDNENDVEVIEYTDIKRERDEDEMAAMKAYMSSKPPTSTATTSKSVSVKIKKKDDDADPTDATNVKNDLALQKLLRESHLLSASGGSSLCATGVARHKSTDLHLQSLGAKGSVFTQKKMPMAQRKHMVQKARDTEAKRRTEAREAGIILETEKRESKGREKMRDRGVGGPSVGRFKGGTLSLSKKDVRSITGGPGRGGKGGKKR
jgi:hypothetical protein